MPDVPCTSHVLLLLGLMALTACSNKHVQEFHQVHEGMSRSEVRELLGTPSSRFPASIEDDILIPERWQYGDTLSTHATGVLSPYDAPNRVWVVYFKDDRVSSIQEPQDSGQVWRPDVK